MTAIGAILAQFFAILLEQGVKYFDSWQAGQKAKQDEWALATLKGQQASVARSKAMEDEISAAVVHALPPTTPKGWNGIGGLALAVLLLSGCYDRTVYVPSRMPVIPRPARPVLTEEPFTPREQQLAGYAAQLEVAVDAYNHQAADENHRNGY